jgi:hypothetical protein
LLGLALGYQPGQQHRKKKQAHFAPGQGHYSPPFADSKGVHPVRQRKLSKKASRLESWSEQSNAWSLFESNRISGPESGNLVSPLCQ